VRDAVEYACFLDSWQKYGKCIGAKHLLKFKKLFVSPSGRMELLGTHWT
jgi:hypothetical protein